MRSTVSFAALALLLSGSNGLMPAMAESGRPITGEAIASAQYGQESAAPADATKLAIREVQEPAPEPLIRQITPSLPIAPAPVVPRVVAVSTGQASWYGPGFFGNRTANGEVLRRGTLTAAHRTLPFGTKVRVTNLWNGRSTVVRINDRGPFTGGRVIDLAHGAASQLGLVASGVAQVKLEVLR